MSVTRHAIRRPTPVPPTHRGDGRARPVLRPAAESLEPRRLLSGLPAYPVFDFAAPAVGDRARASVNGEAFVVGGGQLDLFRSDGSTSGTSSVIRTVTTAFNWNGTLFFHSATTDALYKLEPGSSTPAEITDSAGTRLRQAREFVPVGDKLYFGATTGGNRVNVYVTDGTSQGTRFIHTGTPVGSAGGTLVFWTYISSPPQTQSLWRTDGTEAGTFMLKDNLFFGSSEGGYEFNGTVLFTGPDGLWKSDGTVGGTGLVKQGLGVMKEFHRAGDTLYLMSTPSFSRLAGKLWKTDGTGTGTVLVDDIYAGTGFSPPLRPSMVHVGSTLYFVRGAPGLGPQLFATEGTGPSRQITQIGTNPQFSGVRPGLATVDGKIYFGARESGLNYELWESNGQVGNATKVPGPSLVGDVEPLNFLTVGGSLFVTMAKAGGGSRLWRYGVAASVLDDGGVLVVNGTDPLEGVGGADTISVAAAGDVVTATVNGVARSFPLAGVRHVTVNGLGGDDSVTVTGMTGVPLTVNGGGGQDALTVFGTPDDDTVSVTSAPRTRRGGSVHTSAVESVAVDTLGGADALTVDDSTREANEDYAVTDTSVRRSATPSGPFSTVLLTFANAETVTLLAGAFANVVNVTPSTATAFVVEGNDPGPSTSARDRLAVVAQGASGTRHTPGAGIGTGRWTFDDRLPIAYSGIEQTDDGLPVAPEIADVSPDPRKAPVTEIRIVFGEPVVGFDLADLRLTRAGTTDNLLTAEHVLSSADGGAIWTLGDLSSVTTPDGQYTLTLVAAGSGITDLVGSPVVGDATDTFTIDNAPPVPDIEDVSPDPRQNSVSFVRIRFDAPVSGLTAGHFTLTRNGGPNLLTAAQTLSRSTDSLYAIENLTALTRPAGEYVLRLDADAGQPISDFAGNVLTVDVTDTWRNRSLVRGRNVFYNGSSADGGYRGADPRDDAAIATDKVALVPSNLASFANYTSYDRGINGVMIDIVGLAGELTTADFRFRAGNGGNPNLWPAAPAPVSLSVRPGAGVSGSDRVTIIWADYSIRNKWLQVWMLPNDVTGVAPNGDVFYFGNLVGETGNFPMGVGAKVDPGDANATRNQRGMTGLPLTYRWDHNRDGRVNVLDETAVRRNLPAAPLIMFTPQFPVPPTAESTVSAPSTGTRSSREAFRPGALQGFASGAVPPVAAAAVPNPGSGPSNFLAIGRTIFFTADDGIHGKELWKTDGTPEGTVLLADINPGPASSNLWHFSNVGGILVFAANDGVHGEEPWRSDGTPGGTTLLEDVNPGAANSDFGNESRRLVVGRVMYFSANRAGEGFELWRTDGTAYGTYLVRDIVPGSAGSFPEEMAVLNGQLVFAAGGPNNRGIWRTTGSAVGTALVSPATIGNPLRLASSGGNLYFQLDAVSSTRNLLRKVDAANWATSVVADLSGPVNRSVDVGGTLFMDVSRTLFKTDGTAAGTGPVPTTSEANRPSPPSLLTSYKGAVFFVASDSTSSGDLWRSDGTAEGTYRVKDIRVGGEAAQSDSLTVFDGMLYFTAVDGSSGRQLWRSDGTEAGTIRLTNVSGGITDQKTAGDQRTLAKLDEYVYFAAVTPDRGVELWRSDGTEAGTTLVKDINQG